MDDQKMRASDADRQRVIDFLRMVLDEGRLKLDESIERMGRAAEAVTYGDLAALYTDLPVTGTVLRLESATPAAMLPPDARRGMPAAVRVLWTIWAAAVSVNLVVWVLVCATTAQLVYPWPLWVACPLGAVLLLVSACAADGRHRQPGPFQLSSGSR